MTDYTAPERKAINAAWNALVHLCDCTNWSDGPALANALKLERKQMEGTTGGRAMVVKAWEEGLSNPQQPASSLYFVRPGYLQAFMLGVSHALHREQDAYTGPMVAEARTLSRAATVAQEAHTARVAGV